MKRKIALLLVLCMFASMLPASLADALEDVPNDEDMSIELPEEEESLDLDGDALAVELDDLELEVPELEALEEPTDELDEEAPGEDEDEEGFEDVDLGNASASGVPKTLKLGVKQTFTLDPSKVAKGKKVTYKSGKTSVATVSKKGVITAKKKGKAKISVIANKKTIATCTVTVVAAPKKVTLAAKSISLGVKEKFQIVPKLPSGTMASFTYTSKNKKIATVTKAGVVKGVKAGKTTITVKTHNKKTVKLTVKVVKAPSKVSFAEKTVTLGVKESLTLTPVLPKGTHASYTWSVKSKKIATVTKAGVVKGVKTGKTTVTVKTHNGKKATITVKVVKAPGNVKLSRKTMALGVGQVRALEAKLPSGTASRITWVSSKPKVAKVDENGVVTAVSAGKAKITAKTFNKKTATCTVTVSKMIGPDSGESEVKTVQVLLQKLGLLPADGATGVYDLTTENAVSAFQLWAMTDGGYADIGVTGLVDPTTLSAMEDAQKKGIVLEGETGENEIVIPYGQQSIEAGSLKLSGRVRIYIPETVTSIAENAFDGATSVTIYSPVDSYAQAFADEHGIPWKSCGARYLEEQTQALLDRLDDIESASKEKLEMDYEHIPTKDIVSDDVRAVADDVNAALDEQKKYRQDMEETAESIGDAFENISKELNGYNVDVSDSKMAIKAEGLTFTVYTDNLEKLSGNCTVVSIKTNKAEDSILIETVSGGKQLWIQLKEKELRVLDKQQANTVRNAYGKMVTQKALANVNSVGSVVWNVIKNTMLNLNNWVSEVTRELANFVRDADEAVNAAVLELANSDDWKAWAKLRDLNPNEPEVQRIAQAAYDKCLKNYKAALAQQTLCRNMHAMFVGCSALTAIFEITENIGDYDTLSEIQKHGHPTESDKDEKYELAEKMVADLYIAQVLLVVDTGLGVIDIVDDLSTVIGSIVAAMTGPLGFAALAAKKLAIKATKATVKQAMKKLAAQMVVSGSTKSVVNSVKSKDKKLHESGFIAGTVTDKETQKPVAGVSVSCEGSTAITGSDGKYKLDKVIAGKKAVTFTKKNYRDLTMTVTVTPNKTATLDAAIEMKRGVVAGTVRDKKTKEALKGVVVSCANGNSATTDSSGQYELKRVPLGENEISFSKDGYRDASRTVTVAADAETPLDMFLERQVGTITGTVTDAKTGKALSGVQVSCKDCGTVTTNASGVYKLAEVPVGTKDITFSKDGYEPVKRQVTLFDKRILTRDVSMKEATGTVTGTVRDSETKEPIFFAEVTCGDTVTFTDTDGKYTLWNVPVGVVEVSFSMDGYGSISRSVSVKDEVTLDVYLLSSDIPIDAEHFPDANFREYLKDNYDKDGNGRLSEGEISRITEVDVRYSDIASLEGVEYLTSMKSLYTLESKITSLNVSGCTSLERLECPGNELASLDVRNCTALKELTCCNNGKLTSLNVSGCKALEYLNCDYDNLTGLDVSSCTALQTLSCVGNEDLTALNLSGCKALECLYCYETHLNSLNLSGYTALLVLRCWDAPLTSLNVTGCKALEILDCGESKFTSLNLSGCTALKDFSCGECEKLTSLNFSGCTALQELVCVRCEKLTSLNLSGCAALKKMDCSYNTELANMDLSSCKQLEYVECKHNNALTRLDLSGCKNLYEVDCEDDDQMTSLNVSGCTALEKLRFVFGDNNTSCSLNVAGCTSLKDLDCYFIGLTSLDVSECVALEYLDCFDNKLTSLDVSKCTALRSLSCVDNRLTSLNIKGCTALARLNCEENQLTSLNVRGCTALDSLNCEKNKLTSLDLRGTAVTWSTLKCDEGVDIIWYDYDED